MSKGKGAVAKDVIVETKEQEGLKCEKDLKFVAKVSESEEDSKEYFEGVKLQLQLLLQLQQQQAMEGMGKDLAVLDPPLCSSKATLSGGSTTTTTKFIEDDAAMEIKAMLARMLLLQQH